MIRMVDINDYKEYKYHIRPNQSIWFCNARKSSRCGYERLDLEDPRVMQTNTSTNIRRYPSSTLQGLNVNIWDMPLKTD